MKVDTAAVRRAIQTPLTAVLDGIGRVLRDCPPDLVADLADRGIMMVGGSALLPGLDQMLRQATGMPVHIAERPELCAVEGLGAMLEGRITPMVLDPWAPESPPPPRTTHRPGLPASVRAGPRTFPAVPAGRCVRRRRAGRRIRSAAVPCAMPSCGCRRWPGPPGRPGRPPTSTDKAVT